MSNKQVIKAVNIKAYARLHMGFFDLNGEQGRRFGSVGIGLNYPMTNIKLSRGCGTETTHATNEKENADFSYINKSKQLLLEHLKINEEVTVEVFDQIPRHSGLGSGTQMALAVGIGLNEMFHQTMSLNEIASVTQRGKRSGIGIGTFAHGGLVVDGGRGAHTTLPPIIAQHAVPASWQFILIFDTSFKGLNGASEIDAFKSLTDHTIADTQNITHQVLTRALPAIVEQDITMFGQAMNALQAYNGAYFSPAQGGQYASKIVADVLDYLHKNGAACAGQSSWGPTGFAIFANETEAANMLETLRDKFDDQDLSFVMCQASQQGASIDIEHGIKA